MPRKILLRSNKHPYHVVTRSNHKEWFSLPMKEVWFLCIESFSIAQSKHPAKIHAFVLMNNHYHLIIETPQSNLDCFMYEFNKNFSLLLRKNTNHINRMFGGRYKWSLITTKQYYYHVYKYVYLNPVKAQVIKDPFQYPFSTLSPQCHFPFELESWLDGTKQEIKKWLNESHYSEEQYRSIQQGLIKKQFCFSGSRKNRTPPYFESILEDKAPGT